MDTIVHNGQARISIIKIMLSSGLPDVAGLLLEVKQKKAKKGKKRQVNLLTYSTINLNTEYVFCFEYCKVPPLRNFITRQPMSIFYIKICFKKLDFTYHHIGTSQI